MTPPRNPDPTSRHERLRHDFMFRETLATPEGREALKALLTEDAVIQAAFYAWLDGPHAGRPFRYRFPAALAAAVDALDSPEEDT